MPSLKAPISCDIVTRPTFWTVMAHSHRTRLDYVATVSARTAGGAKYEFFRLFPKYRGRQVVVRPQMEKH